MNTPKNAPRAATFLVATLAACASAPKPAPTPTDLCHQRLEVVHEKISELCRTVAEIKGSSQSLVLCNRVADDNYAAILAMKAADFACGDPAVRNVDSVQRLNTVHLRLRYAQMAAHAVCPEHVREAPHGE